MSPSNPPSRGSTKNDGKQNELAMEKDEGEMEQKEGEEAEENKEGRRQELQRESAGQEAQHEPNPNPLTPNRSLPNMAVSMSSTPKRPILPPSGIKVPVPPAALLNGNTSNIHKSASSSALPEQNTGMGLMNGTSMEQKVRREEEQNVQNMAQMMMAARGRQGAQIPSPRAGKGVGARLPPLQLPKMPNRVEPKATEKDGWPEPGEERRKGMIATVADRQMPQMQQVEPTKNPFILSAIFPQSASVVPPSRSDSGTLPQADPLDGTTVSMPRLPSQHIPNEIPPVHHHLHPARRRPSSAGAMPVGALTALKPLPAISEPIGAKRSGALSRSGATASAKQRARRPRWRLGLKCAVVAGFLCIPVVIFLLMMLSSDGFSSSSSTPSPSSATSFSPTSLSSSSSPVITTPRVPVMATTTEVNIVGGAIFQPISMQNESTVSVG